MTKGPVQQSRVPAFEVGDQPAVTMAHLLHARQQVIRHHRRQSDRDDHAGQNGHDVGHAQRREQPPLNARQDKQRHKHQHDDDRGIHDGRAHFERRAGDDLGHRAGDGQGTVELEPPQNVFYANDSIVHQFANGNRQASQRHRVDGQTKVVKHQGCRQQRDRDGGERNKRGAYIQQEQEQHHRNEDGAVAQGLLHVAHRVLDEVGLLEEKLRCFYACRKAFLQLLHGMFNFPGQRHAVSAGLLLHRQNDRRLAVVSAIAAFECRCDLYVSHLAEQDRLPILHAHHDVLQILQAAGSTDLANQVFAPLGFEKASAGVGTEITQRTFQFFALNAQCLQLRGADFNAVLAYLAANGRDLGDTGYRQQPGAHNPVCVLAHLHGADLVRVGWQCDQQDFAHDGRNRSHLWHNTFRQLLSHQVQALADLLAVAVDVRPPFKFHIDDGQANAGNRTHPGDARHAVHARLDWEGDELLHFLGRHTAGFGHQRHCRLVQVREHVHRHLAHCEGAIDD